WKYGPCRVGGTAWQRQAGVPHTVSRSSTLPGATYPSPRIWSCSDRYLRRSPTRSALVILISLGWARRAHTCLTVVNTVWHGGEGQGSRDGHAADRSVRCLRSVRA